jgi:hypothetical protein
MIRWSENMHRAVGQGRALPPALSRYPGVGTLLLHQAHSEQFRPNSDRKGGDAS